jgi:hypothetical protein
MENAITVKQLPVIQHDLKTIGANVRKRIADLNLSKLVISDETLQYLKKTRAELNKDFAVYEEQRKAVKKVVLAPYDTFESEYKAEISNVFADAEKQLKDGITSVEIKAKDQKKEIIKAYFEELCATNEIDFVTFERTGIEINLSTTEKKYKEQCQEFISRIKDDLVLIDAYEHKAEVLVEYKRTLNCSQAITTVKIRKEAEGKEAARLKQVEEQKSVEVQKSTVQAPEVLQAPKTVEQVEEKRKASFIVTDTVPRLLALRQYLIDNNYKIENI